MKIEHEQICEKNSSSWKSSCWINWYKFQLDDLTYFLAKASRKTYIIKRSFIGHLIWQKLLRESKCNPRKNVLKEKCFRKNLLYEYPIIGTLCIDNGEEEERETRDVTIE